VDRIVPGRVQAFGKKRRQVVVDQEFHAECLSGSSLSRTASAAYSSDS
jgi:7-keto-8-aminopelargonate synthetase-like enzyme